MVAEVYDPTGEAKDIFKYARDAAQEAGNTAKKDALKSVEEGYAPREHQHDYATARNFTVNVGTEWQEEGIGYFQTVAVSGILAADDPIADVVLGEDAEENSLILSAWSNVTRITTAAGAVTIWCKQPPTTEFTVKLKVVR